MTLVRPRAEKSLSWMKVNSSMEVKKALPKYRCYICKDWGLVQNPNTREQQDCACKKAQDLKRHMEASGIYELARDKTFEKFLVDKGNPLLCRAKRLGMNYTENFEHKKGPHNSVAFLGTVGAGKTHLSFAIANELLKRNMDVAYFPYREEITRLKQNIINEKVYQNRMNIFKNARVLLLDDLFKGKVTESEISIIFELINDRYLRKKATIISSELTIHRLMDIDEAVGSRILEVAKGSIIQFQEPKMNYRLYGQ